MIDGGHEWADSPQGQDLGGDHDARVPWCADDQLCSREDIGRPSRPASADDSGSVEIVACRTMKVLFGLAPRQTTGVVEGLRRPSGLDRPVPGPGQVWPSADLRNRAVVEARETTKASLLQGPDAVDLIGRFWLRR